MKLIKRKILRRKRRQSRIRKRVFGTKSRPRLSVFRSLKNIYCQLINDEEGKTIVSASSFSEDIKSEFPYGGNIAVAEKVGEVIAKEAIAKGINDVVFDRRGYKFHGRIKSLAESARKNGLNF